MTTAQQLFDLTNSRSNGKVCVHLYRYQPEALVYGTAFDNGSDEPPPMSLEPSLYADMLHNAERYLNHLHPDKSDESVWLMPDSPVFRCYNDETKVFVILEGNLERYLTQYLRRVKLFALLA